MPDGAQGDDRRPDAPQAVGLKAEQVLIEKVLDDLEGLGALGEPGAGAQIVRRPAVPAVEVDDLAGEGALGLLADGDGQCGGIGVGEFDGE